MQRRRACAGNDIAALWAGERGAAASSSGYYTKPSAGGEEPSSRDATGLSPKHEHSVTSRRRATEGSWVAVTPLTPQKQKSWRGLTGHARVSRCATCSLGPRFRAHVYRGGGIPGALVRLRLVDEATGGLWKLEVEPGYKGPEDQGKRCTGLPPTLSCCGACGSPASESILEFARLRLSRLSRYTINAARRKRASAAVSWTIVFSSICHTLPIRYE